jgi:hypothetical protein
MQPRQRQRQRAFARTRFADQRKDLVLFYIDVNAVNGGIITAVYPERRAQIPYFQQSVLH